MARKRMIDPSIWEDEDFGELDAMEQILFISMFSNADDHGRLRGNLSHLKAAAFRYKDVPLEQVKEMRDHLLAVFHKLQFYVVDGREYLCFLNWSTYQSPSHPTPSKIPPPQNDPSEEFRETFANDSRKEPEPLANLSLLGEGRLGKDRIGEETGAVAPAPSKKRFRVPEMNADVITKLGDAFAEATGCDPAKLIPTTRNSWAKVLVGIHEKGYTGDDIKGCVACALAKRWCTLEKLNIYKLADFLPMWEGQGKPTANGKTGPPEPAQLDPLMQERVKFELERGERANAGIARPGLRPK